MPAGNIGPDPTKQHPLSHPAQYTQNALQSLAGPSSAANQHSMAYSQSHSGQSQQPATSSSQPFSGSQYPQYGSSQAFTPMNYHGLSNAPLPPVGINPGTQTSVHAPSQGMAPYLTNQQMTQQASSRPVIAPPGAPVIGVQGQFGSQQYSTGSQATTSRINPTMVPSPVVVNEADQSKFNETAFVTSSLGVQLPPLPSTMTRYVDDGTAISF